MEHHERKSMYTKCFETVVRPVAEVKVVKVKAVKVIGPKPERAKRIGRDDPAYEAPDGPMAEVRGNTVTSRIAPSFTSGHVNPRLLELAKYGR